MPRKKNNNINNNDTTINQVENNSNSPNNSLPKNYYTGRPYKHIDKTIFENLCNIQCTVDEICSVLEICKDTLEDWSKREYNLPLSTVLKNKSSGGKASLRRTQWKLAQKYPNMAIWLGKQYLDQRDIIDTTVRNEGMLGEIAEFLKAKSEGKEIEEGKEPIVKVVTTREEDEEE